MTHFTVCLQIYNYFLIIPLDIEEKSQGFLDTNNFFNHFFVVFLQFRIFAEK